MLAAYRCGRLPALAFVVGLLACSAAFAQAPDAASGPGAPPPGAPTDLWVPLVDEFTNLDRAELETVFSEVLGGPLGERHVVGLTGIEESIRVRGFQLPSCFEGRDVCSTNVGAIARSLGADRVIIATARELGRVLHLTLLDIELDERVVLEVRGDDIREAVFAAVGAVTDASGHLSVSSDPPGAAVYLDNLYVGTTPYEATVGIGAYDLKLVLEGYYDHGTPIEVRSNDRRSESIVMQRRHAQVVVACDAPGAEVVVGGTEVYPVGETFGLLPGRHELEIRAPGYDSATRTLDVLAGEERSYRVTLVESAETIARRKYETIRGRPLVLQLGLRGGGYRTSFSGARIDDSRQRIDCAVDPSAGPDCLDPTPVGQLGGDIDVIYDVGAFELQLLGFGVRRLNLRSDRTTFAVVDDVDLVEARQGRELVFQLPQPGFRIQIDHNWSFAMRTGPAVAFQRVEATRTPGDEAVRMKRTDWLWTVDATGRYHATTALFVFAELGAGIVLDAGDTRARLGGTFGLGFTFGDPSGVYDELDGRHRRQTPPTSAPGEL